MINKKWFEIVKKEFTDNSKEILNDPEIKKDLEEISTMIKDGITEVGNIFKRSSDLKNFEVENLIFKNIEETVRLKDLIEMSNKYRPSGAEAVGVYHTKNFRYHLLSIFYLDQNDNPMISAEKNIFINIKSSSLSEDLISLLNDKQLVILK